MSKTIAQHSTNTHEIPYWTPAEANAAMQAIDEARAKQAYADMLADAQFPPGSVADTHA